jgi:phospholipid/cholesterol/gamma-HCH transport system substrate-binding protein
MQIEYTKKEKVAGFFIIAAFCSFFALFAIIGVSKDLFKSYTAYYAVFNEGYNLQKNAAVKLFKADIGKVKNIEPYDNKVRVEILILDEFASRIRKDTMVTVESPTFIGSEYISVYPGSTKSPLLFDGEQIISKEKKSITDIMEEFEIAKTAKMFVKTIQDLSNIAKEIKDPNGPLFASLNGLNNTINNIETLTNDMKNGKGSLGAILTSEKSSNSINQILSDIHKTSNSLPDILENVKNILIKIDTASNLLNASLENIKKGSNDVPQITRSVSDGVEEIRDNVKNLDKIITSLKDNFLIKFNLPKEAKEKDINMDLR